MTDSKQTQVHKIGELCDDLVEHIDDGGQAEAIATAEQILRRVRQLYGASQP